LQNSALQAQANASELTERFAQSAA